MKVAWGPVHGMESLAQTDTCGQAAVAMSTGFGVKQREMDQMKSISGDAVWEE